MAESKGSQGATGRKEPGTPDPAGTRRSGWSRWRPYSAAIVGVAAVFTVSAAIGAHVRGGEQTTVKVPGGLPSTGPLDLSVPVRPDSPVTVTVYEDLRDPASKAFAQKWQPEFTALRLSGRATVAYRLVTASDEAHGGHGALYAANAAGCAQDQGKSTFAAYVDQLWKNQPADPADDRFASEAYLERLSRNVKDLTPGMFVPCVKSLDHQGWVRASQRQYAASGLSGVPVVEVNGTVLPVAGLTPARLDAAVKSALARVMATATAGPLPGTPGPSSAPTTAPASPSATAPTATPSAPGAGASAPATTGTPGQGATAS